MNKAQQMLAKAGFPDTAAGRAAFHKQYPTPESFFQVHGGQDTDMYGAGSTIHIDPSKRGTFTAAATKHDKSVQEFASQVLANKENYSPAMVKKANFARNAASWKHEDGGTVDALQLMGMPTPLMYGEGSFTGNPYSRFSRKGRNTGDDHITGFATGFGNAYTLPQGYSSSGASGPGNQNLVVNTNLTGVDYTKDFYNDNNISLGGGLSLGRAQQNRGSLFKTFNYTTPHGTPGTGYTHVAGPESKTFMTGDLHGNVDAHLPLFNPSWGAQRQGHRNIGAGNVEVVGLNASLEGGLSKFGSGKINPYYDASAGLGFFNNMMNINAGYTNRTGNSQVSLPSGSTAVDTQKGQPYVNMGAQVPLWIDNKGNTRFKVFGGWGTGPYDQGYAGASYTFADGGPITDYSPSYNFGHVQSKNNTYRHGFANGGHVGMYGFGSTIKDLGYGMADSSLGTIGSLTGIKSMQDIVDEDQYSNDKFDDVANFAGKVGGTAIKFIPGVGQVVGAVGAGAGALANTAFKIDERNYDPSQHTSNWDKVGNFVEGAGNIASSFVNPMGAADTLSKGAKTAMNVGKIAGLGATGINAARDIDKSQGGTYDPTNLLNLGMGVARSGFFGGNTNTSNNFTNTKGAVDYTPTMDTPLYAAMGGAVNAPNMMKYAQGGGVNMTEINVEHGELLTDENGNILTEYGSNALPPHPADGSMDDRGTVPAPEGAFVVTAALAEKYKLADKLQRDAMRNNITIDKQRKEAKQAKQAEQEQMMQQQNMMMQQQMMPEIMMGKHGGMVRGYGYGGGVKMYGLGGPPEEDGSPYTQNNPYTSAIEGDYSYGANNNLPNSYFNEYMANQQSAQDFNNKYNLNLQVEPFGFPKKQSIIQQSGYNWNPVPVNNTDAIPFRRDPGETWGYQAPPAPVYNASKITGAPDYGYGKTENAGKYPNTYPYQVEPGEKWDTNAGGPNSSVRNGNEDQGYPNDKMDIYDYMRFAPAAWNAIQALKKPSKVPSNLGNVDTNVEMPRLSSYSAEQAIDAMDAKDKYLARQAGTGSNYLAFLTAMNNQKSLNKAKVIEGYRNAQAGLDAEGVKLKKSLQAQNAQAETQRYMLQAQADAVPTEYASKAMTNLGDIGNTNYTYNRAYPIFQQMYPEFAAKMRQNKTRR